jgi:para-aminobenzoate synthetase/4-amino-4-deoxychorismate lyase
MIVDMVRNDLGRVARTGSVNVRDLFVTEKYPTVWQMTSTVEARTDTGLCGLFRGAYPAASITGAPKVRTMQIIEELEATPRHVYTGAIGFVAPDGRLQFNVAIRTLLVDTKTGAAEYGVGSGVVWDSDAIREWDECATKTKILTAKMPLFHLLETMLWKPSEGIILEEPHIQRLTDSAQYFAFNIDFDLVRQQLHNAVSSLPTNPHRVRLLCGKSGDVSIEATRTGNGLPVQPRVGIARGPINAADAFLYHKTTNRSVYDKARRELPGYDDVVLYNEDGEVTESTIANVVAEISGELRTPPVRCGLLPGTMRADLLAQGSIIEGVITLEDLIGSPRVFLVNSLRGMVEIHLSDTREQPKA